MKTVQEIMAENGSLANIERFQTMQKWDYKRKMEHAQEMAEAFYCWAYGFSGMNGTNVCGNESCKHYEPSGSYMDPPTCAIGGCYLKRPPQSLCYVEVQD